MKDKKIYIALCVSILLVGVGVSLAYFGIKIIGNDTAKGNKVVTGNLELTFTDTNEISLENAFPGDSFTKTISVKNTGTKEVSYNLVWTELTNEITNNELVIEAACKRLNSSGVEEGTCNSISQKAVSSASNITSNIPIKSGYTQEYTIKITFIDTGRPQNYNKNKSFSGKLGITESSAKTVYCTFDGELTQGTEYVNGQYTYRYMQERALDVDEETFEDITVWINTSNEGWGVGLTDKESTAPVNTKLCTYINNKPVTSMSYMFYDSQASSIDLSSFDTSNIINMNSLFERLYHNVVQLNVSSFNTSKVTSMESMFRDANIKELDVTGFDTSNVTSMNSMFSGIGVSTLDLSNFDTSNVTDMGYMFYMCSSLSSLDLSKFNTSKVTVMSNMFSNDTNIKTIDVSSFDTSNVTNMYSMFSGIGVSTLDLSNFDTSKVTDMTQMFVGSHNLKTIYTNSKFNISNVTRDTGMFKDCTNLVGGEGTTYDSNHIDKTYAHIDGGAGSPGYFTKKPAEPSSFTTDSWDTIAYAVRTNNLSKYNVGDTKDIDLGTTYGTHTVRIANTSTPAECSTEGFSQSACGFVLEFADIITTHNMNSSSTNVGGWPATTMRTFVNNDIYNSLPADLKNAIIDTTVVSGHGSTSGETNFTSTDKLYLLAPGEVWTNWKTSIGTSYDTAKNLTRTLDYYTAHGVTTSNTSGAIKKKGTIPLFWWLRAAYSNTTNNFLDVNDSGCYADNSANYSRGVAPAFRLG